MRPLVLCCLLVALFAFVRGSDSKCCNAGGTCQLDSNPCSGSYRSGLCSGPYNRRCCVPSSGSDTRCCNAGGTCQLDSNSCSGSYRSGLCSGPNNRRCCVPSSGSPACSVISRDEWDAAPPKHTIKEMPNAARFVFIHHGASAPCYDESRCKARIRAYQNYHMTNNEWSDIGYNFVVGEDGNAYMGRGWTEVGAHTKGYNSVGIAICVIGNFSTREPNSAAVNKVKQLIQCGLDQGHISPSYTLKGHRDVADTSCPGNKLYDLIQSWSHYKKGTAIYG